MKKMFYALALIVSSFFLFNIEVNAKEKTFTFSNYDDLGEDFLTTREWAINTLGDYYKFYIITYNPNKTYSVHFFSQFDSSNIFNCGLMYSSYLSCSSSVSVSGNHSVYTNSTLPVNGSSSMSYQSGSSISFGIVGSYILDSNINFIYTDTSSDVFNVTDGTNTISYSSSMEDKKVYTKYEFYNKFYGGEDHTHDSELSIIQSFYEVSISKISYLADSISSNYIYLSIFGVFILIFVFELIFRRYL